MNKDYLKKHYYSKLSRNEIIENDKFDIIQKFGFSSFMTNTSIHSYKKSFVVEENTKTKITKKNNFLNNKSTKKPTIIKIKTLKNSQQKIKIDFPLKNYVNNYFSYTQKIDFNKDKKNNKISISQNDFPNSNSLQNYSSKNNNNNSNLKTNDINKNKNKVKIKSIKFNKSFFLKQKSFCDKNNFNENNHNKKNVNPNEMSKIGKEINMSEKRELYNKQNLYYDNNSHTKEEKLDQYYNMNENYSSENISRNNNLEV